MLQWAVSTINPMNETTARRSGGWATRPKLSSSTETLETRRSLRPSWSNYVDPLQSNANNISVNFNSCYTNSVLVTMIATVITLLINSMAAFALAKYKFRGQRADVRHDPCDFDGAACGYAGRGVQDDHHDRVVWIDLGVIIPGAATPAGVFLLRQYMLTIPEELIEAARMDAASEWKVYWKIVLPLALPAIAALGDPVGHLALE